MWPFPLSPLGRGEELRRTYRTYINVRDKFSDFNVLEFNL